jgi:hypothetical protein
MHACFHYQFHPVGQGLFGSGCLYQSNVAEPKFLWVYDCGSSSHKAPAFWVRKARELKAFAHYKAQIDLLVLSHFDNDHINGVDALLNHFDVDRLLIPYVPLWKRLLIAFEDNLTGDNEVMSFVIDPIGYLQRRESIRTIILVPSSDEQLPPPEASGIKELDGEWKLRIQTEPAASNAEVQDFGNLGQNVEVLVANGTAQLMGLWEFCPYNVSRSDISPDFVTKVSEMKNRLLQGDPDQRQAALDELKKAYEKKFRSSKERNAISLLLYSGPIYGSWRECKLSSRLPEQMPRYPARLPCYYRARAWAPGLSSKCSVLYSGDSYLDTNDGFSALLGCLGHERMGKIGLFQVNHHGARDNWHPGLAAKINSEFSIFSSNPLQGPTYHPHPEVWSDFRNHGQAQVNTADFGIGGWMLA